MSRLVVYGAGAIGGQIAVRLANAGLDPLVVEPWDAQREAIQSRGLTMQTEGGGEERASPATIAPHELAEEVSLLLLCVKSYDTMDALAVIGPRLADDGLLVSMQNSINEEWIAPEVGAERTVGGVILVNGSFLEPGRVQASGSVSRASLTTMPGVYVGEYGAPAGERARRVADVLANVWPAEPVDDLLHERWSKMVNNTMLNPVSAVGGMRSAELLANADARRIAVRLAAETMRVAEAEGHPLARIMGDYDAVDVYANAAGESDVVERGLEARGAQVPPGAMTSMYQDVRRGRKTEVDYFSGIVSQKGASHGIATPYCDAITALVHRVESGDLTPSPESLRLVDG
ncbi:MAG: ketopantoate reductase family protein [Chloroflexota bacterium]|nr:ketopantoate reductase family protein [Chloroflexota bacterium]MDE2885231.1 ketopantoate reductase family protein [Chloroflexota bacterium]